MTDVLSIGEFSRATGLTTKALRLYDQLELLRPAEVDQRNGYRSYAEEQVDQARLVARLRSVGVPLPRIATILAASTPEGAADEVLSYWHEVEAERASTGQVIGSLLALLTGQDHAMPAPPTLDVSLADLIARLYDDLPDTDDLARVREARLRARALAELGDQLVDHYVSEAKLGGASWDEISAALARNDHGGAARRTPNPFERFTDPARHSIVLAQEAARAHRHQAIGTGHLLLGLLDEARGLARRLLVAQTGSDQDVRDAVARAMSPGTGEAVAGHIAFAEESKDVIARALRASSDLDHDWVGTEHLLLGLVSIDDGVAARVLADLGCTPDGLRALVVAETDSGPGADAQ